MSVETDKPAEQAMYLYTVAGRQVFLYH